MQLDAKEIEAVINKDLLLDFVKITLTQDTANNPNKYTGPGSIYIDTNGILRLKMYHIFNGSEEIQKEFNASFRDDGLMPGQIIGSEHYFSLVGIDMKGRSWTSSHVNFSGNTSFPAGGMVIETKLQRITMKKINASANASGNAYIVSPGKYELPCNKLEKKDGNSSLSICSIDINSHACEIKNRDSYIEIIIDTPSDSETEHYSNKVLEAISICTGIFSRPQLRVISKKDSMVTEINSIVRPFSNHGLPHPVDGMSTMEAHSFQEFSRRYITAIHEPYSEFFGYWYRIFSESSGELENQALVLTTAIEGVLKKYFSEHGRPDDDFINQTEEAQKTIKALKIGERVKGRILSSLGNSLSPTPKNSLHSLEKMQKLPKGLIKIWIELRNKSAHADELKQSESELQEFLDLYYGCLELFYVLLLQYIEYKGKYVRYSQLGWPVAQMTDMQP